MTIDHDAIAAKVRQDRKAGTPGPWALSASGYNVMRGKTAATVAVAQPSDFSLSDARRISALPDLEAAYLDLYDEVKRLRGDMDQGALDYCDLMTRHDAHFVAWQSAKSRAEKAEAERERLLYVLDGVAGAIDTGRNEPLQVWRDQINIARQAMKGQTNE